MSLAWLATIFILLAALSYTAVAKFSFWAQKEMLDVPNERSSHKMPKPRGGGLIFVLFTLIFTLAYAVVTSSYALLYLVAGGAIVAAISWWDDQTPLPSSVRFSAHFIAALLLIVGYGPLPSISLPVLGNLPMPTWGLSILTLFWLVGLTNAYNFMDGIDGIAGLQGIITTVGWFAVGWWLQDNFLISFTAVLGASILGFLGHNWSPARIFMGDVGSAFLGFTFAALPVTALAQNNYNIDKLPFFAILTIWPFLFDTSLTIITRFRNGENIFAAHRSHLYQKLALTSDKHAFVSGLYGLLALWGTCLAYLWLIQTTPTASTYLLIITLPLMAMLVYLAAQRTT